MTEEHPKKTDLQIALDAFIQTITMEQAYKILKQYPELLGDQTDLLLSSIINKARKQGYEDTALALDERREFIRSVRQELLEQEENAHH